MKVGEDNPQARDEEVKLIFIKHGMQYISGWNSSQHGKAAAFTSPISLSAILHSVCC